MKIRKSFITNSSSASFVVQKKFLGPSQINRIKNFIMSDKCDDLPWTIKEYLDRIEGETLMDNGALESLFSEELGLIIREALEDIDVPFVDWSPEWTPEELYDNRENMFDPTWTVEE